MFFAKIIKNFRIWSARIADWRLVDTARSAPPVFFIIIEEDTLVAFDAPLITSFGWTNFSNLGGYAGFAKNLLPKFCSLIISRDAIFFIANKASDIKFVRV